MWRRMLRNLPYFSVWRIARLGCIVFRHAAPHPKLKLLTLVENNSKKKTILYDSNSISTQLVQSSQLQKKTERSFSWRWCGMCIRICMLLLFGGDGNRGAQCYKLYTYNFLKQDRQVAYNIDSIVVNVSTPDVRYHRALEDTKSERCLIGPTHPNVNSARWGSVC